MAVAVSSHPILSLSPVPVPKERFAALDAVRGGAMLLGIALHAAISYMPQRPTLYWGIFDDATHPVFAWLFWWIHAFRLPLFFLIAGFFAPMLYESRGPRRFFKHRMRRLLMPFLAGSLVVVPGSFGYDWCCRRVTGAGDGQSFMAMLIDPAVLDELLGPMHLWFLEDLFILSMLYLALRLLWQRRTDILGRLLTRTAKNVRPTVAGLLLPALLAAPTALMLSMDIRLFAEHHNSFVPDLGRLAYYGYCFLCGTMLYRWKANLLSFFAWPILYMTVAAAATVAMLLLLPSHLAGGVGPWPLAIAVALTAWFTSFACIALAMRWCNGQHRVIRYLADASFWIYLCHLPVVAFLQIALYRAALPAAFKFTLVAAITTAVALLSYRVLGRRVKKRPRTLNMQGPIVQPLVTESEGALSVG